jgi:hypothetical protein
MWGTTSGLQRCGYWVFKRCQLWLLGLQTLPKDSRMTFETKEFYNSPNGDRWLLVRHSDSVRVFIRNRQQAAVRRLGGLPTRSVLLGLYSLATQPLEDGLSGSSSRWSEKSPRFAGRKCTVPGVLMRSPDRLNCDNAERPPCDKDGRITLKLQLRENT